MVRQAWAIAFLSWVLLAYGSFEAPDAQRMAQRVALAQGQAPLQAASPACAKQALGHSAPQRRPCHG